MSHPQLITATLLILASAISFPLKTKPTGGWLLVANKGEQTLGIVDPETGRQISVVAEGAVTGHEVVASPDGRFAYVPIYGNSGVGKPGTNGSTIVVVDLAARRISGTVDLGRGVRPHCAVFGPRDGLLYVTTEIENSITVIDPKTLKVVGTVPTGQPESHMLAISHDGKRGYTANVGPGTVSVLDLASRKPVTVIPVCRTTQRISLSVDDRFVFTADQSSPRLAVIDTATNKVKAWITLPGLGYGSAPTPDGKWLVIALPELNKVAVIDLAVMKVTAALDVPASPQEVLIPPDGKVAYVSCDSSRKVAVINVAEWKVEPAIDAGKGADGLAWAPSN